MTSGDGKKSRDSAKAFTPHGGRVCFIAEQEAHNGYLVIGIQESTSYPSRILTDVFIRLVAGGCPRRSRRIELWLNLDKPRTWIAKRPRYFTADDAITIGEGHGFATSRCLRLLYLPMYLLPMLPPLLGRSPKGKHVGRT